jgi:hypothetical protein
VNHPEESTKHSEQGENLKSRTLLFINFCVIADILTLIVIFNINIFNY